MAEARKSWTDSKLIRRTAVTLAGLSLAAGAAGCGSKDAPRKTTETPPVPAAKVERPKSKRVTSAEVKIASIAIAGRMQALSQDKKAVIEEYSIHIPCDNTGNCSTVTKADKKYMATVNAHQLEFELPRDPSKKFVDLLEGDGNYDNVQSFFFKTKHASSDGKVKDLKSLQEMSIMTNSRAANGGETYFNFDVFRNKKFGGWSIEASYADFPDGQIPPKHDIQFCFNTAIDEQRGQVLPLHDNELTALLGTVDTVLTQTENHQAISPIAIPRGILGREVGAGYDGCSASRPLKAAMQLP